MIIWIICLILAYLLGSINCAIIICKIMGLPSPYTTGSGNPGATNVKRIGGTKPAAITLFGDALKGLIPVLAGHYSGLPTSQLAWVALAAVIGHLLPLIEWIVVETVEVPGVDVLYMASNLPLPNVEPLVHNHLLQCYLGIVPVQTSSLPEVF